MTTLTPTIGLIALRGSALVALLSGQAKLSQQLYKLANFIEAGMVSDEQMKAVSEKLANRDAIDADFEDVLARIDSERGKLHVPAQPATTDKPSLG